MSLWNNFLLHPLINLLIFCYQAVGNNLGLSIILTTILVRLALLPLILPSLRSTKKIQDLKPELDELKEKYNKDKQKLAQKQMELYKERGINPAAGFLPMIIQLLIVIALYQAFNKVIFLSEDVSQLNQLLYPFVQLKNPNPLNTKFLYLSLFSPDVITLKNTINLGILKISNLPGIFLLLAAVFQFLSSYLINPVKNNKNDKKEDDMASSMQKQMLFMGPIMTLLIGFRFSSGLVLYWITYSLFMSAQQIYLKKQSQKTDK